MFLKSLEYHLLFENLMEKIKRKKRRVVDMWKRLKQEQTFRSNEFRCFHITANECSYYPEK